MFPWEASNNYLIYNFSKGCSDYMQIGERRKYDRSSCLLIYWNIGIRVLNFSFILQGSLSFLLGIFLIFVRWPVIGIVVELYGCILLFGLAPTRNFNVFITITIIFIILIKSVIMCIMFFSPVDFGHLSGYFFIRFQYWDGFFNILHWWVNFWFSCSLVPNIWLVT